MVESHRPPCPQPIVVKRGRPPRLKSHSRCVICDAELRGDHGVGDLICDCHRGNGYNPRHDARFDNRVLALLANAYPEPLNLLHALGTDDRYAVRDCVNRWRGRGVPISGVLHVGYVLCATVTVNGGAKVRA